MKKEILEISGIRKSLSEKNVLSNIYLTCETTNIIALLGRNGSGKSTLLKIVAGFVPAQDKCIRINSVSLNNKNALSNGISYLSQENFIPKNLTVQKTISLSIDKQNHDKFCEDEFIRSILNKKIIHLSSGELRYLEIKLVLFNASKFVLLDEPYNGLSPLMISAVNEMIRGIANEKGIIITDHNYQNVLEIATHIVLMKDGKTHHLTDKKELVEHGYLPSNTFI